MMGVLDRVRELKYTAPSGAEFSPMWDGVERSVAKKAAVYEYPQSDTGTVQDLGDGLARYPMTLYFSGDECDTLTDALFSGLLDRGPGMLAHPRWGDLRVLPLNVVQTEDFVGGLRQSVVKVEFVSAPEAAALTVTGSSSAAIQASADLVAEAAALETAAQLVPGDAVDTAKTRRTVLANAVAARDRLSNLAAPVEAVKREIDAIGDAIERSIDILLADPEALVEETLRLIREPAREAIDLKAKADAYSTLITSGLASLTAGVGQAEAAGIVLNLLGLSIALAESVTEGTPLSREQAISVRDVVSNAITAAEAGISAAEAYGYVPTPETVSGLAALRTNASAYLLESAFSLPTERTIVLDHDSTAINLAWELLGDPELMDEIIDLNGFGGMIVLPRGTEVRYYA